MPMSSPQMTRMFGFFAADGDGDCAFVLVTVKENATRISAIRVSFILICLVCYSVTGKKPFRRWSWRSAFHSSFMCTIVQSFTAESFFPN